MARPLRRLSPSGRRDSGAQTETLSLDELAETTQAMPAIVDRRSARMRGRGWLAVLVVVAVAGAAGGWMASRTMESPREVAARSQRPAATIITAAVQSTTIRSTVISRGRVEAVDSVRVGLGSLLPPGDGVATGAASGASASGDGAGGDEVLTGVFAKRGDGVRQGQVVVEVNGRPVIVLQGTKASYRDIEPGMSGVDVAQLQRSLAAMGEYSGPINGVFDGGTKAAVDRMYRAAGYAPPSTDGGDGTDEAAIQADRDTLNNAISTLTDSKARKRLAQKELSSALEAWKEANKRDSATAGPKPTYQGPSDAELSSDGRAVAAARRALDLDIAHRGTMVPRNEVVFVPHLPATVTQIATGIGYAPQVPLFTVSAAALVLDTLIPTSQAGFVKVGSQAEVDLPSGQVSGLVISVRGAPTPGQTQVSISTPDPLPISLEGADVKVTFVAASTTGDVLAVPEGAVNSDANGDLSVIVQAVDQSLTRVPVTVGVTGSDVVEVKPKVIGALSVGDVVVVGG